MSEKEDGKASGWSAWYSNNKWQVEDKRKKAK
jgi:DNA topoisomerase-1